MVSVRTQKTCTITFTRVENSYLIIKWNYAYTNLFGRRKENYWYIANRLQYIGLHRFVQ
jgi:hypothetical protein